MGLLSLLMIYVVYYFLARDVGLDKKMGGINSSIVTFIPLRAIVAD